MQEAAIGVLQSQQLILNASLVTFTEYDYSFVKVWTQATETVDISLLFGPLISKYIFHICNVQP